MLIIKINVTLRDGDGPFDIKGGWDFSSRQVIFFFFCTTSYFFQK